MDADRFEVDDETYLERHAGWTDVPSLEMRPNGTDRPKVLEMGDLCAFSSHPKFGRFAFIERLQVSSKLGWQRATYRLLLCDYGQGQAPKGAPFRWDRATESAPMGDFLPELEGQAMVWNWGSTSESRDHLVTGRPFHAIGHALSKAHTPIRVCTANRKDFAAWLGALGIPSTTRCVGAPGMGLIDIAALDRGTRPILFQHVSDTEITRPSGGRNPAILRPTTNGLPILPSPPVPDVLIDVPDATSLLIAMQNERAMQNAETTSQEKR